VAIVLDLTVYVSLYSSLHTVVEVVAGLCLLCAVMPGIAWLGKRAPVLRFGVAAASAAVGLLVSVLYVSSNSVRTWAEDGLRHVWREPVYVGRMLSRVQVAESYLRDPGAFNDTTTNSILRLRQRYDLATTTRSRIWDKPPPEPEWLTKRLLAMRGENQFNIIVYYVDTLRADVARDAAVMPGLQRFSQGALNFRRAYTTGSNTLHALPGLTGGNFDLTETHPTDLIRVAEQGGYATTLVIAQSAREFLGRLLPTFRFKETVDVPDYAAGNEQVWGYGADQPTSERIVSRGLEWLLQHRDDRFLLWLFNFDVHNWREVDEAYVDATGRTYGVPEAGELTAAKRAVGRIAVKLYDTCRSGHDCRAESYAGATRR
jgi:hypothetical protein